MVAYSFQRRFVEPILAGTKGGTIRADRKGRNLGHRVVAGGHAYPGEELQLYTGMRTKQCQLIARERCVAVEQIRLDFIRSIITFSERDERIGRPQILDAFARFDGFNTFPELAAFWLSIYGLYRFEGWHIRWQAWPAPVPGLEGKASMSLCRQPTTDVTPSFPDMHPINPATERRRPDCNSALKTNEIMHERPPLPLILKEGAL